MRNIRRMICALLAAGMAHAAPPASNGSSGGSTFGAAPVANTAPVWSATNRTLTVGDSCAYSLPSVSTDANGDTLSYSTTGTLPTGCSFSANAISGTASEAGEFSFTLLMDDGRNTILRPSFETAATAAFNSVALTQPLSGSFALVFQVTPVASNIDHVIGFGTQTASGYAQMLAAVRFNTSGSIDARNNNAYQAANAKSYTGGNTYTARFDVDCAANRYDVTVDGTVIANDYVPRGGATLCPIAFATAVDAISPGTVGTVSGNITLIQPIGTQVTWTVAADDDETPPDAPEAPTVAGVTQTTVDLTLPASGAADHAFYRIQRSPSGCGSYAQIADNVTDSTYQDSGLTQNTAYCYRLVDVDASGNASTPGSGANATTAAVDVNALLSIANVSVAEGDEGTTNLTFTLTASASQSFDIVCQYETLAVTADSSTDFTAAAGTVTISSGDTTEDIEVTVNGDTTVESDETLTMRVYNCGAGGTSVNSTEFTATGAILNDDSATPPGDGEVDVSCGSQTEGDSPGINLPAVTCTFTIDPVQESDVMFDYYTVNGTATAWVDYVPASGVGIIRAGQSSYSVPVYIIKDTDDEPNETFEMRVANQREKP
jgi:hypothetical protein